MRVINRARMLPDVVRDLFGDSVIVEAMHGLRCTYMLNILVELGCGDYCCVETSLAKTVEVLNHTNIMVKLKWIDGNCTHQKWQPLWNFVITTAATNKPAEFLSLLQNNDEFSAKITSAPTPRMRRNHPASVVRQQKPSRETLGPTTMTKCKTKWTPSFLGRTPT